MTTPEFDKHLLKWVLKLWAFCTLALLVLEQSIPRAIVLGFLLTCIGGLLVYAPEPDGEEG